MIVNNFNHWRYTMKTLSSLLFLLLFSLSSVSAQTTWKLDKTHSGLDFNVRYMMLTDVRGTYTDYDAILIQENDDFSGSRLEVTINSATINTHNADRDNHLRSADFFDVENHPEIKFVSTSFDKVGDNRYKVEGNLTIRDVTKPVVLDTEYVGTVDNPRGGKRAAFKAMTTINRDDFGVQWNRALEAGGFMVGKDVNLEITAQFISQ